VTDALPLLAFLQETAEGGGSRVLVGGLILGVAAFDLLLAFFFAFVRPHPDQRTRSVLPLALGIGALVLGGLGAAILAGVIPIG